MGMVGY